MQFNGLLAIFAGLAGVAALSYRRVGEIVSINSKRGIRNNNPGNLVKTGINWKGKVPEAENTDGRFEQFTHPVWGIRAMFMDLRGDIEKDGKNTLAMLLAEYAPDHENDLPAYVASVSQRTGLAADQVITPAYYDALVKAIIHHENGEQPYSDSMIQEAMALA